MSKSLSENILVELDRSNIMNEVATTKSHKMNSIKYETRGYTEATDGMYKGEPIVNYREKDFKKGTTVLTPFICGYCGKEFYVKTSIHDFFKHGDFDDPYETPIGGGDFCCPKCKNSDNIEYNGEVLIKEPGESNRGELNAVELRKYKKSQLDNIKNMGFSGDYKIKVSSAHGTTEWLDISSNEFAEIEKLITRSY